LDQHHPVLLGLGAHRCAGARLLSRRTTYRF
jgi:hypothetical protein